MSSIGGGVAASVKFGAQLSDNSTIRDSNNVVGFPVKQINVNHPSGTWNENTLLMNGSFYVNLLRLRVVGSSQDAVELFIDDVLIYSKIGGGNTQNGYIDLIDSNLNNGVGVAVSEKLRIRSKSQYTQTILQLQLWNTK